MHVRIDRPPTPAFIPVSTLQIKQRVVPRMLPQSWRSSSWFCPSLLIKRLFTFKTLTHFHLCTLQRRVQNSSVFGVFPLFPVHRSPLDITSFTFIHLYTNMSIKTRFNSYGHILILLVGKCVHTAEPERESKPETEA